MNGTALPENNFKTAVAQGVQYRVMNSLLIRGLRQRRFHGGGDWRELMTNAVRGEWPATQASQRTLETERGLGIGGEPYYFYILRAEESFGLVVFVLREVGEADWPEDAKGATPFDSGGLWLGKVATHPKLDEVGRRRFFQDQDVPLVNWRAAFEEYIRTRYRTVSDYIRGSAPEPGNEPQDSKATIIKGSPNDKRAWTWEVRVPHDLVAGRLELRAAYMIEADRRKYIYWLWCSSLTESESRRIHQWIKHYVVVPTQDESAVQAVENQMALEVVDD